jgi:hypothetical protein
MKKKTIIAVYETRYIYDEKEHVMHAPLTIYCLVQLEDIGYTRMDSLMDDCEDYFIWSVN